MLSSLPDILRLLKIAGVLFVVYNIGLVIYRLYLHPLRKFPGPKLNAVTLWVDFYYEVYLGGQMTFKLKDWHDKYGELCSGGVSTPNGGPIIRVNPNELHILDPEFYDDIYTSATRPRDKWSWWTRATGQKTTMFATIPHDVHRMRRGLLSPYFSKKSILEDALPLVRSKVNKLLDRLRKSVPNRDVIQMDTAFTALTLEIITKYSVDKDTDYLERPDFFQAWSDCMNAGIQGMGLARQFPYIFEIIVALPTWVMQRITPTAFADLFVAMDYIKSTVDEVWYEDASKTKLRAADTTTRRNMIHTMRDAVHLPAFERTPARVVDETAVLLSAGSETTAHMLSITSYYLLRNPDVLSTLRQEISSVIPTGKQVTDVDYTVLEKLPFLTAVVNEGLRTSHGVIARLPRRVSPSSNEKLKYKEWDIPKGAAFSMSGYYIITDPEIFPKPNTFLPQRWLLPSDSDNDTSKWKVNTSLNKYLTNFSKGSRACLGINLAYVEIYTTLAMLVMHVLGSETEVGMELYEVDFDRDVKMVNEYFTGFPSKESKGIRMRSEKQA